MELILILHVPRSSCVRLNDHEPGRRIPGPAHWERPPAMTRHHFGCLMSYVTVSIVPYKDLSTPSRGRAERRALLARRAGLGERSTEINVMSARNGGLLGKNRIY
jgi:hypothetical protein